MRTVESPEELSLLGSLSLGTISSVYADRKGYRKAILGRDERGKLRIKGRIALSTYIVLYVQVDKLYYSL